MSNLPRVVGVGVAGGRAKARGHGFETEQGVQAASKLGPVIGGDTAIL